MKKIISLDCMDPSHRLVEAISNRDLGLILTIIRTSDVDVNCQNKQGRTALMYAAYCKDLSAVVDLVERGADVRLEDEKGYIACHFVLELKESTLMSCYTRCEPTIRIYELLEALMVPRCCFWTWSPHQILSGYKRKWYKQEICLQKIRRSQYKKSQKNQHKKQKKYQKEKTCQKPNHKKQKLCHQEKKPQKKTCWFYFKCKFEAVFFFRKS